MKVIVVGPRLGSRWSGGYVRKMQYYVDLLPSIKDIDIEFCYQTVPGDGNKITRFLKDTGSFIKKVFEQPFERKIVHILGQYRGTIVKELAVVTLSRLFGNKVVYEIKAGEFITSYESGGKMYRWMVRSLIRNTSFFLCQGKPYMPFLASFDPDIKAAYHPNFIESENIRHYGNREYFHANTLNVGFVGTLIPEKGVLVLLEAMKKLPFDNWKLYIIGAPTDKINETFIKENSSDKRIEWVGAVKLEQIHEWYAKFDVFCLPTVYSGEGHNNSINEAINGEAVILTTRHGFVESFMNEESGYFLEDNRPETIAKALTHILEHKEEAIQKAKRAKKYLTQELNSNAMLDRLKSVYNTL